MKPHLCCAARHVSPLPHALTQFQILHNYKHQRTSGMRVFSTFGIIILENYVCPFWLKHRSRACERGSLLGPALSLTEVCSVDIKRALEALLGTVGFDRNRIFNVRLKTNILHQNNRIFGRITEYSVIA